MGVEFIKAKIARIEPAENQNVTLHHEAMENGGGKVSREHDLVVLSLGMVPEWNPAGICPVSTGSDAFIHTVMPKIAPTLTNLEGVFWPVWRQVPKTSSTRSPKPGQRPWRHPIMYSN